MNIFDVLPIVASLLFIVAAFVSPRWTPRQRWIFAALLAFYAVGTFFSGSPWARLNGATLLFAVGVVAMSAHRMAKANRVVQT